MNLIEQYISINSHILKLYDYLLYDNDEEYLYSLNSLTNQVERISSNLIKKITENKIKSDDWGLSDFCEKPDYYLLKIELYLRLIFYEAEEIDNERIEKFLSCLLSIYNSKDETIDYERAIYLAGVFGEFLLGFIRKNPKISSPVKEKIREVRTWEPVVDGDWYGYKDHIVKLKSFV